MGIEVAGLSRAVSHALRHDPQAYGLEPDEQGWVEVDDLVAALRTVDSAWAELSVRDLDDMIEASAKRRHEIRGSRIRAAYGHSTPGRIEYEHHQPPVMLYHGTTREAVSRILAEGLRSGSRHYVHLSEDLDMARQVGRRRDRSPAILEVRALAANRAGVDFYRPSEGVWLADFVPRRFLRSLAPDAY